MLRSALFTLLLALPFSASAADFDYTYVTAGYARISLDDNVIDVDGDGFALGGSFEVSESFFVAASYGMAEFEEQGIGVDLDSISVGVGWHTPLSDTLDFVTSLSYESVEASALGLSADDDGIGIGVGLRYAASEVIEFNGGISYVNMDEGGDDTGFGIGVLYGITDNFDIGLTGDWADDTSAYGLNARLYFGN